MSVKKSLFTVILLSAVVAPALFAQGYMDAKEAALFLRIRGFDLGTLSPGEEKSQYLSAMAIELRKVQDFTLGVFYEDAKRYYNRGDYEHAKEIAERILAMDPNYTNARLLLEAAAKGPGSRIMNENQLLNERFAEGKNLYRQGQVDAALSKWKEVIKISPRHEAKRWYDRVKQEQSAENIKSGYDFYALGQLDVALDKWYAALKTNPDNPALVERVASVEAELSAEKANESMRYALDYYAEGDKGKTAGGDRGRAYVALKKTLELNPSDKRARQMMDELKDAVARDHFSAGKSRYSKGAYTQAIKEWQTAEEWGYDRSKTQTLIAKARGQISTQARRREALAERARREAEEAAEKERLAKEEEARRKMQEELAATADSGQKILPTGAVSAENKRASEEFYVKAVAAYQDRRYSDAQTNIGKALELDPGNESARAWQKRLEGEYGAP